MCLMSWIITGISLPVSYLVVEDVDIFESAFPVTTVRLDVTFHDY